MKNLKSPYELFLQKSPPYNRYKVFGSRGFKLNHAQHELQHTSPNIYHGIDGGSLSNLVYIPKTRQAVVARDIKLHEAQLIHQASTCLTHDA